MGAARVEFTRIEDKFATNPPGREGLKMRMVVMDRGLRKGRGCRRCWII